MAGLTIGTVFRNAARAVPHRTAAVLGDEALTFAEIDRQADALAHALSRRGIRRGDRVVCWTGTRLEVVPLFAALARMGAVYCPLPANLGPEEALRVMSVAEPSLLILDSDNPAAGMLPAVEFRVMTLEEITAEADPHAGVFQDAAEESDTHVLFFTSGSTGPAQGRHAVPPRQLPAQPPGLPGRAARRDGLHLPALPHGRLDHLPAAMAGP